MIWLLVLGIIVLGLVILVLAVLPVLRRLRNLDRVMRRTRANQEQAAVVQASVAKLQERMAELQVQVEAVTARMPGGPRSERDS